jgi:simple sugar transport system substrate-binding protein
VTDGTPLDRGRLLRMLALAGGAAALGPANALAGADAFLQPHPRWRFVFVNHAITNPFFAPARYGIEDASDLLGTLWEWRGSVRSSVADMVRAMRHAIRTRADGIAVSIIDPLAFNGPTAEALKRGIPVVSYNADGGVGNQRLAYVGQDLYQSGLKFGARIAALVEEGDVVIFIATPGQLNIQPRVDGALDAIKDSGKPIRVSVVATGAAVGAERRKIEDTYRKHRGLRGMFAVDGGSTQGVADVMREHDLRRRGVRGGGYDLLPRTLRAIAQGHLDFTIDQQPYLQGFLPVLQLFFARYSGGLVAPSDTSSGNLFVTKKNVEPYVTTRTRYEGSSAVREFPVS